MKLVVSEFMSLDGVVQAPGGPDEDVDGGFRHGGWSMPWFDPDVLSYQHMIGVNPRTSERESPLTDNRR